MSKKYSVSFMYNRDQRAEEVVEAASEIAALAIAQSRSPSYSDWSDIDAGFHIRIDRVRS